MRTSTLLLAGSLLLGGCSLIFGTGDITENDPVGCANGPAACVALVAANPGDDRLYCLAGEQICAPFCDFDADCDDHPDGEACLSDDLGDPQDDICGCRSNEDCGDDPDTARPVCDPRSNTCVGCRSDDDCPARAQCDTDTGFCRPIEGPQCDEDEDGFRDGREECRESGIVVYDCDDTNGAVFPGAPTICRDGAINNCEQALPDELLEAAGIDEFGVVSSRVLTTVPTTAERITIASAARPALTANLLNVFTSYVSREDPSQIVLLQWSVNPTAEDPRRAEYNVPCAPDGGRFQDIQDVSLAAEAREGTITGGIAIGIGAFWDFAPEEGFALGRIGTNVMDAPVFEQCRLTGAEPVVQATAGFDNEGNAYVLGVTDADDIGYTYNVLSEGPLDARFEGNFRDPISDAEGELFVIPTEDGLQASPLLVPDLVETVPESAELWGRTELIRRADQEGFILLAPRAGSLLAWDVGCSPEDTALCLSFEQSPEVTPVLEDEVWLSGAALRNQQFVVALRNELEEGQEVILAVGNAGPATLEARVPLLGPEDFDGEAIVIEDIRLARFDRIDGPRFATGFAVSVAVRRPAGAEIHGIGLQACDVR